MKTLFKLKEQPLIYKNYMSNEKAEEYYKKGKLPFKDDRWGWDDGSRRVSCGFFSRELSFSEWIDRYQIVII